MKEIEVKTKVYESYDSNVNEYLRICFDSLGGEFYDDVFLRDSQKALIEEFLKEAKEDEESPKVIQTLEQILKDFKEGINYIIILTY